MAEPTRKKTGGTKVAAVPDLGGGDADGPRSTEASTHQVAACPVALCPICALVTLIQPLSPDVVEHLLNAGREFLLAAKAALDALASDSDKKGDDPLEKIDIG